MKTLFFFFIYCKENGTGGKITNKRRIPAKRKAGKMTKQGGLTTSNLLHRFSQ